MQTIERINELYNFLTPVDENKDFSTYFVYGTKKSFARALFAAELYKINQVPVVVSDKDVVDEYVKVLKEGGLKDFDIFEESKGSNFVENSFNSISVAKENNLSLDKVGLVSASLVALRAQLMTQLFLTKEFIVCSLPVETDSVNPFDDPTSFDNWFKYDKGVSVFLSEIVKLYFLKKFRVLN